MKAILTMAIVAMAATGGTPGDAPGSAGDGSRPGDHTYGGATGPGSARGVAEAAAAQGGGGGGGPVTGGPRDVAAALDVVDRAAEMARTAVKAGKWEVARAHVVHLNEWLVLATRMQRPTGEAAVRWDFAAREAKRLEQALAKRDAAQAKWADAALALAIDDARASLGGGAGAAVPAAPTPTPKPARMDPELKYEDIPLDRERPWSRGRM